MSHMSQRKMFSICIPAYNRHRHLPQLLDSILSQDFSDFEVVICEDNSRERAQIKATVSEYAGRFDKRIKYYENERNLGYDANIRNLVQKASARFCFFMGNDDVMCPGALNEVARVIGRYPKVGLVLKSYAWFDESPDRINQEIRYFDREHFFSAGAPAIRICYRRSGVISGYIVDRDLAHAAATDRFDGTLYYQMHLTANVLAETCAVFTPRVLVLCRSGEPPEFGGSQKERGIYTPGAYTPEARISMIRGALDIIVALKDDRNIDVVNEVKRDYANYFYPYIKDQLKLPLSQFWRLYRSFSRLGFYRYPIFHLYFMIGYLLGEKRFDILTKGVRTFLGRSPQIGLAR